MKTVLVVLAVTLTTAGSARADFAEVWQAWIDKCRQEWTSDYRMVRHCADRQGRAFRELMEMVKAVDEAEAGKNPRSTPERTLALKKIIGRCGLDWRDDWAMVLHCADRQAKAYGSLEREGQAKAYSLLNLEESMFDDLRRKAKDYEEYVREGLRTKECGEPLREGVQIQKGC
jgi:hypothetical protein